MKTIEELEKYREEKKLRSLENHEVTSELREIIDTITTKTLAGELDQETTVNLLSDLMATNILDIVKSPEEITEGIMDENIEETRQITGRRNKARIEKYVEPSQD